MFKPALAVKGVVLVLAVACGALAPMERGKAQDAKPPKETPSQEKRRIIKERRPDAQLVAAARAQVSRLDPSFLRLANTLRALAHRNPKFTLETRYQDDLALPELGSSPANADELPDTWVELRLLALLRSGYPAEPSLLAELDNLLASKSALRSQSWAEASLSLILVDAIVARRETGLGERVERALERGRAVAANRDFNVPMYTRADITHETLIELMHIALCRSYVRKHGLLSALPETNWKKVVGRLLQLATQFWNPEEVPLWESSDPKLSSAQRSRAALILGVLLNFACDEPLVDISAESRDGALKKLYQRMPPAFDHKQGWRAFKGDAAFLFMSAGAWRESEAGKQLVLSLSESLLTVQRLPFMRPRPESSHIATALGWTLAAGGDDDGMGRAALTLQQRDHLGTLCLALLAASGGILGDLAPEEPLEMEMLMSVFEALDVLELEDFYGNMLRTDDAIENGAQWLFKQQNADGTFPGFHGKSLGGHALSVLMLLEAGMDRDDPGIQKAMRKMRELGPTEKDGDWFAGSNVKSFNDHANYSMALMQMAFCKYYEKEEIEAGIFRARSSAEFLTAQQRMWSKLPKADRDVIGHIAWAVSNNDGYGWGYGVRQPKSDPPQYTETPPAPEEGKPKPVTGEKREAGKEGPAGGGSGNKVEEGKFPPRPDAASHFQHCDNSNSQYAVLGLKAALLLGAPIRLEALAWEAQRLVENFTVLGQAERPYVTPGAATVEPKPRRDSRYADPDANKRPRRARAWLQKYDVGCWSYFAGKGTITIGTKDNERGEGGPHADEFDNKVRSFRLSVAMTAAGISSLSILRDALLLAKFRDSDLLARMETAMAGGLFMLGLKYPYSKTITTIDNVRNSDAWWRGADGGPGMMYDMYSCERAGVLTSQRYFANIDWYRDGADLLIDKQTPEGNWRELVYNDRGTLYPQTCSHCFAILFLKRCAPPLSQEPPEDRRVVSGERKKRAEDPARGGEAKPPAEGK